MYECGFTTFFHYEDKKTAISANKPGHRAADAVYLMCGEPEQDP
jgi:hypothetical protein